MGWIRPRSLEDMRATPLELDSLSLNPGLATRSLPLVKQQHCFSSGRSRQVSICLGELPLGYMIMYEKCSVPCIVG